MNNNNDIVLEAVHISKSFGELNVLEDLNFSVRRGEFIALIGPSGCGKTTLIRTLAGLTKNFSGTLLSHLADKSKLPFSMAFQHSPLFPWLNIADNIKICINFGSLNNKEKHQIAIHYLTKVGLAGFEHCFPGELSGGMIQRVNIARAFASDSEIIFMDEPFVYLDFLQRISLQKMTLKLLENELKTVFFITHNIHEAVTLADRILVLSARPGRIIGELPVNIPHPRDVDEVRTDKQYITLVREMTGLLSEEIKKSQAQFEQCLKNR